MNNISKNQIKVPKKNNPNQLNGYPKRTLMDLNMMDAFLFDVATEDDENAKKIAKIIIERVTGHTVGNLIVENQKQLKGVSLDTRGIRMDLYVSENAQNKVLNRLYDIEPNKYYTNNLPYRSRFSQALIDSKLLPTGTTFEQLPELITIWILPYDPFGDNRMLYTVKNKVVENPDLMYNDGVTKLFLYTKGTVGGSKELKALLTYLENTTPANAVDKDLLEIQEIVGNIKSKEEVGERYMTLQELIDYEKQNSYEYGLLQGTINTCKSLNLDKSQVRDTLLKQFDLTEDKANEYLELYW